MKNSLPQCLTLFIKMQLGNAYFYRLLFLKIKKKELLSLYKYCIIFNSC